jgi:hypothetical protein
MPAPSAQRAVPQKGKTMKSLDAKLLFTAHQHPPLGRLEEWDAELTRANCHACQLSQAGDQAPTVAGWERIFVAAGREIPVDWLEDSLAELSSCGWGFNQVYLANLLRDIGEHGVTLKGDYNPLRHQNIARLCGARVKASWRIEAAK